MNYFDLHCDTITECYNIQKSLTNNGLQLDRAKVHDIQKWVQVFAIWLDDALSEEKSYEYFNNSYDYFKKQVAADSNLEWAKSSSEMESILNTGKNVAFLSIENSKPLAGKIDRVKEFYDKGVRIMTLTWNEANSVADGCMVSNAKGLTDFGKDVVKLMEKLGMIIDVSHLSEAGFWDVATNTTAPFIATHSNSYFVCEHPRNLKDQQFEVIVERGGIVGMNFFPVFINNTRVAQIEELLPHIDRMLQLGGEDVIAMGSDFDGAVMPQNMRGIQDINYLYDILVKRYGIEKTEKMMFANAERFFCHNLK